MWTFLENMFENDEILLENGESEREILEIWIGWKVVQNLYEMSIFLL